jgi:cephalosporin hydroxylase
MSNSLLELVDNNRTDKNTNHSYLPLYECLLSSRREHAKNVLEVGICSGGSIRLWHDYFGNATIHGVDIINIDSVWDEIKGNRNIRLYTSTNAYDSEFISKEFVSKNIKFDMVLDDGPHTLESMIQFVQKYSPLLVEDGILIIEDVQDMSWLDSIKAVVPVDLQDCVSTYDLRGNKGRWDDIVFVIDKSKR